MYTCLICGKKIKTIDALQVHLRRVHKLSDQELEEYYVANFKKDGEGLDPMTGQPTEFISFKRGYKFYARDNNQKYATNTIEHHMLKGLTKEEAQKRVDYVNSVSSVVGKEIWKRVKSEGKTRGGWSKKHFLELGFTEEQAEIEVKKRAKTREEKMEKHRKQHRESGDYKKFSNCCIEFYLERGYSQDEAEEILKQRQATNKLETYIKKYGEELGYEKFMERNKRWSENIEKRYKDGEFSKCPCSDFSLSSSKEMIFCEKLIKLLNQYIDDTYKIHINKKDDKQYVIFSDGRRYFYDFVVTGKTKRIIEFNGDFWHMNPKIYQPTDMNRVKNKSAQELWDYMEQKKRVAREQGFEIVEVWESDWKKDEQSVLEKCVNFIINGTKF